MRQISGSPFIPMPMAPSGSHRAPSFTNRPRCGVSVVVVSFTGGGACTGGGAGFLVVVVVVVVVVEVVVLTVISATAGVGTMVTGEVVLVLGADDGWDVRDVASPPQPATTSTRSRPALATAGIHSAFRVSTGCTLRVFRLDL